MSIQNAITMLDRIDSDADFRKGIYRCNSKQDFTDFLEARNLVFTEEEFEEAVNFLHCKCQTFEQASMLLHRAEMVKFLIHSFEYLS